MSWLLKKKVGLLYLSEALGLELQPAVHPQAVAELLDVDRAAAVAVEVLERPTELGGAAGEAAAHLLLDEDLGLHEGRD